MVDNDKCNIESGKSDKIKNGKSTFKISDYGVRHQQTLIMFLTLSTAYSMRACFGVALVSMIDDSFVNEGYNDDLIKHTVEDTIASNATNNYMLHNNTEVRKDTPNLSICNGTVGVFNEKENDNTKAKLNINVLDVTESEDFKPHGFFNALLFTSPFPKFRWSKKLSEVVQSSFFWGYMVLQIPAGLLVHKFGPRRLISGALGINSFVSFIFPWASYYGGWVAAMLCRLTQGLSQTCIVPGLHSFFGKWAPLEERARLVGFAQGGQAMGTVLGIPVTAFIAASPLGWPGIFRFYGVLSGLFAFIVYFLVADTPSQHPKISALEKQYIEKGLGLKEGEKRKKLTIPWAQILRSKALLAIVVAHIGQTYGQLTLFSQVPSYMANVMNVNIKANGMLTALPFLIMWFTSFFFNWFTDMIINKKYLSVTNARKLANFLGNVPPAIGLVILAHAPKNIYVVEALLIIICAFKISSHVGFMVNHIDMTPNFAGTTMSISNFVSNLVGSQAPIVAGFILTDVTSEYQWRFVFYVAAALYFFSNLVYLILGSAEKAPWNDPPKEFTELERQETQLMIEKEEDEKLKQ